MILRDHERDGSARNCGRPNAIANLESYLSDGLGNADFCLVTRKSPFDEPQLGNLHNRCHMPKNQEDGARSRDTYPLVDREQRGKFDLNRSSERKPLFRHTMASASDFLLYISSECMHQDQSAASSPIESTRNNF